MLEVIELTRLGDSPKTYREMVSIEDTYKWCVIKHKPRGQNGTLEPDVIALQDRPVGTGVGHEIPFMGWWDLLRQTNNDAAWAWLTTYEAALFNNNQDPEQREIDITKPVSALSQTFGGNLKAYDKETKTHIRLVAYNYLADVHKLNPNVNNFANEPWMFMYPNAINEYGVIRKVANGIDVFVPQLSYTELWIRKSEVILLAQKPATWGIQDVMSQWI